MIEYTKIKKSLLDLVKSPVGLVKVIRTVTKDSKTFTQSFWVKPDEVQSNDRVMAKITETEFTISEDAIKFFGTPDQENTMCGKWFKTLSQEDKDAITVYTGSVWTFPLNCFLRGQRHPYGDDNPNKHYFSDDIEGFKTLVEHLDKAIDDFVLEQPITVHRQVNMKYFKNTMQAILDSKDRTFYDAGYMSTTPIKGSFTADGETNVHFVIKVPAGKGVGAWIQPLSKVSEENEFLLPRGLTFKIENDLSDFSWGKDYTLHLTVISRDIKSVDQLAEDMKQRGILEDRPNPIEVKHLDLAAVAKQEFNENSKGYKRIE